MCINFFKIYTNTELRTKTIQSFSTSEKYQRNRKDIFCLLKKYQITNFQEINKKFKYTSLNG